MASLVDRFAAMRLAAPSPSPGTAVRTLGLSLAGEAVELRPCGALWWPARGVLVVSDVHFEKGSAYAARGQMLPPYDTAAALLQLERLVTLLAPATVICLGDSFHDRGGPSRMAQADARRLAQLVAGRDWIWIEGNHDPHPPPALGGRVMAELRLGGLVFRHEPVAAPAPGEVAGHLHPCARVIGDSGRSVRTRCFATCGQRLVMPAFGALTGGLNVLDTAFAALFPRGASVAAMGRDGVYLAAAQRLAPDRLRA